MSKLPYFFDEELNKVSCHTYNEFLETVNILTEHDIDVNRCGFTTPYNIFFKDGSHKDYVAWYNMFSAMKEDFGIEIDLSKSFKNLSSHYLYFYTNPFKGAVGQSVVQQAKVDSDIVIPSVEVVEQDVVTEETTQPNSSVSVDYDFLMSMYDISSKAKSKDKLEKYCIENYGINIRKNQSFDKMIEELRSHLEDSQ